MLLNISISFHCFVFFYYSVKFIFNFVLLISISFLFSLLLQLSITNYILPNLLVVQWLKAWTLKLLYPGLNPSLVPTDMRL